MTTTIKIFAAIALSSLIFSCKNEKATGTPKPYGYFRIEMPENAYQKYETAEEPYIFEFSQIAEIKKLSEKNGEEWLNIIYPQHKATIYLTYRPVKNNLDTIINDSHYFTYRHTIKADAIEESLYLFPEKKVYGLLSDIEGNAASPLQFLLTDSVSNFIRGSLYFEVEPNIDSVAPVVDFIRKDIVHLMQTFEWKNIKNRKK
jgi:gliding motility-associated lipoprotein GldD